MAKRPPRVLKVFPSLPRVEKYPMQEFKCRVVQYHNSEVLLDIREHVTSEVYTGYTPKGVSLTKEQFAYLIKYGPSIMEVMDSVSQKEVQEVKEAVPSETFETKAEG